jgi:hypothetical protein
MRGDVDPLGDQQCRAVPPQWSRVPAAAGDGLREPWKGSTERILEVM